MKKNKKKSILSVRSGFYRMNTSAKVFKSAKDYDRRKNKVDQRKLEEV